MLSSNMLLQNLIPLIDVTFSTPTGDFAQRKVFGAVLMRYENSLFDFSAASKSATLQLDNRDLNPGFL
jgi:hypothetical protein